MVPEKGTGGARRTSSFMRAIRLVACAAAAAVALVPGAPGTAAPTTHQVTAGGGPFGPTWMWEPSSFDAARKDRVVWSNDTGTLHHVAFYEGPLSGKTLHIPSGGKDKLRLKKAGVYRYRCDIQFHSEIVGGQCLGQCGEITVE